MSLGNITITRTIAHFVMKYKVATFPLTFSLHNLSEKRGK